MPEETVALVFGLIFTFFVVAVFIAVFVSIAKRSREQKTQQEYASRYAERHADENAKKINETRHKYLESLREKKSAHELHQMDAHMHNHLGEEEHYEEIVGSLGDINDEGCADLDGVRFIAHDIAYELKQNEHPDYAKIAQAVVLGDVINNPRFKQPYFKK